MSGGEASSTDFDKKKFDIIANEFDKINFLKLLKSTDFIKFLKTDENDIKAFMNKNAEVLGEIIKQNGEVLRKIITGYDKKDIKEIYNSNPDISRIANIIQSGGSDTSDEDDEDFEERKSRIYMEIVSDIILFFMFICGSGSLLEFLNDLF